MEYYISYVFKDERYYIFKDETTDPGNPKYQLTKNIKKAFGFFHETDAYMTMKEKIIPTLKNKYKDGHFEIVVVHYIIGRKYDNQGNQIFDYC